MPNFIDCWAQVSGKGYKHKDGSDVVNGHDRAAILERINEHVKSGLSPAEAAKAAINSHISEADGQLNSVYEQAPGLKPKEAPSEVPLTLTPTVRVGEQSFKGKAHPLAIGEASKSLAADAPIEDLFKPESQGFTVTDPATGKERFVDRKEAADIFEKQTGKKPTKPDHLTSEDLRDAGLLGHLDEKPAAVPAEAGKPEVVKLSTSKYKNPQGDPMGTTYRGTAEDFKAYQDVQEKIKALREEDPGMDNPETNKKLQEVRNENERIKNKYGGMPPEPPAVPAADVTLKTRPVNEAEKTGEMYGESNWTHVEDVTDAQGNTIGKIRGNAKPDSFQVKGANIEKSQQGKGIYQKVIRQLAEKYGTVQSDTDMQPAAEAAWQKVGATRQADGSYKLSSAKAPAPPAPVSSEVASTQMREIVRPQKELEQELRKEGWNVSPVKIAGSKNLVDYWDVSYRAKKVSEADSAEQGWNKISDGKLSAPKGETPYEKLVREEINKRTEAKSSATAPRGIAASARVPGALKGGEAGAISLAPVKAAVEGAKAARDTVGNVVRFYSEPLTERLAAEGGTNAKGFANMSNEIAQRSKELFGSLTPTLDPALEATGKMNRTTTWLNDIAPTTQKWGYRNAVKAVEGPITSVPADHVPTVNQLKASNLAIGKLPESVVPGYRASGRYQRAPTAAFVDAIRSQKGPMYEMAMRALGRENGIPIPRVKEIFKGIKAEFDEPGSKQTINKIAQEFERHFPKFPTDLKIKTPFGEVWTPILHAKPFEYLLNSAQTTAQRVAFLERVPKDTLVQLRKDVVAELKDPAAFDDLVRSLHGLPVNEPLRLFAPGTMQEMIASGANRVLTDVFSSLKLTASAIYNIPETVLGNTPAFFGWRNFIEGAATLKGRHEKLETLGAINRAIYNFSIDPKAPVRTTLSLFRQGVRKATAQQFFNEMQEMLAASTAQVFSERAQGKVLSAHEQSLFTETATAMGFTRPQANAMARGTGSAEQYGNFVRRAASFATGGNIQPAELSRFGANRILNGLFRFQSYPIMKLNAFRKAYVNFAEAVESKNAGRIKASSEQMAKFLFNTTAQGAATAFVAALLTGRGGGVKQTADDAKDEPGKFIFDSVASGLGGPVAAINYAVGTGKAGDLVNPKNINAGSTFPGSIYLELKQMFNTEGPYSGMSLKQAVKKYVRTKIPAGKAINHALEEAGLISSAETTRKNLFMRYDKWLSNQTDPKIKADYERNKGRVLGDSKYDMLDAALADKDEVRAIKAIAALKAEKTKNLDILERMRPYTGQGINSRTKPLFLGEPPQFKASLTPDQRKEYQKALAERKATYQEFLKAWHKRDTAPKTGPEIDFVPDAGQ